MRTKFVNIVVDGNPFSWSFAQRSKILTARLPIASVIEPISTIIKNFGT